MARLLLVLLAIALTVFAVADWATRSSEWTPGRVNRWLWLAVIVLLPVIGPLVWIIIGLVTRAEADRMPASSAPVNLPPDDNPEAISDVANRIVRRQKRTKPEPPPHIRDTVTDEEHSEDESDADKES
ncbi:PLD nuclease N-terminal domain-containing protein [Actinomycetaceae bacterium MB13-C1-2]|nr:PLD nuclease N-terminal domain-containing protein [Actinomycetaceae bacterium MB13-C1-2]